MNVRPTLVLAAVFFTALCVYLVIDPKPASLAKDHIANMGRYGELVFVLLLVVATVAAPVTVLPLIPLAASVFGPFKTGVLSVIGWTVGSSIAFLVARKVGRPILERFVNLEKADRITQNIPERMHFWFILLLRHTIPVDVLSYALGLVKGIQFSTYFWATFFGVIYFSFAFAYATEAFFEGKTLIFIEIILFSVALFTIGWYLVNHYRK